MKSEKQTARQRLAKRKKPVSLLDLGLFLVRVVDVALRLINKYSDGDGDG